MGYGRNLASPCHPEHLPHIGASILVEPFLIPREMRIEPPVDWSSNLARGKTYDEPILGIQVEPPRIVVHARLARDGYR